MYLQVEDSISIVTLSSINTNISAILFEHFHRM